VGLRRGPRTLPELLQVDAYEDCEDTRVRRRPQGYGTQACQEVH